jgi:mannosylglycerate hydrolase
MTEQLNIILVPHTHWDREWYQTFQQFRTRLVRTIDKLLDILDRDKQFSHFMLDGQTIVLDDYLEVQPEQEEHIKQYTRSGRILVGPWYVQPDEFLVSGEALIRNLQFGLQRAAEFGNPMRVGYVPDSFGHIAQMPQILRGVGIDSAVFWRGVGAEARKSEFYWQAPDGTRILVIHLADPLGYSNARQMPLTLDEFVTRVELLAANILPKATTNTLLFMNGSDHLEAQEGLPEVIAEANKLLAHIDPKHKSILTHHGLAPEHTLRQVLGSNTRSEDITLNAIHVELGTLPEYIEAVRQQHSNTDEAPLQTLSGEMRSSQFSHLLPSVLSTRMWIKQQNTATEHLLERWVEPLTAWAAALGNPYPKGLVRTAWKYLLQNHAHDSICGCSIDQVHRENSVRFAQSQQIGESVLHLAMQQLVAATATQAPFPAPYVGYEPMPIVVFNPAPGPRTAEVQTIVQFPGSLHNAMIVDQHGRTMPYRVVNRWRQELGSMPIARDMLYAAVALAGITTPPQLISMAHTMMTSALGQTEETHAISRIYIQDYTPSPLHHEPHPSQPGVVYVEVMIAPKGRVIVNEQEINAAGEQILELLQRNDIHTFEVSLVDQARETIDFLAADLPAYGLKTFWLYPRGLKEETQVGNADNLHPLVTQPQSIENEFYTVSVSAQDGTFTVIDKQTGAAFAGLNRFIDGGDVGDLYNYCPPEHDMLISEPVEPPKIELINAGPVRATLRIAGRWPLPSSSTVNRTERSARLTSCQIVSEVSLRPGVRRVDIHTTIENKAKDHRLRVIFPVPFTTDAATAEGTFEVRTRPIAQTRPTDVAEWAEEPVNTFPQKRFVDVSNGQVGLGVLNRGLPEYEIVQSGPGLAEGQMGIALTLLRCVEWLSRGDLPTRRGHAGPMEQTPEAQCLGQSTFDYALVPHRGTWEADEALVLQEAQRFNTPVTTRAVVTEQHTGLLPSQATLVEVEPRELVVSAIKRSNNGKGLVVRIYNPLDRTVSASIRSGIAFTRASVANLLEEPGAPITVDDQCVHMNIHGEEITTVVFD